MGADSKIEWTHHTFNPWWGCARVSPGCERCYAEAFAKRTGKAAWGVKEPRRFFGDKHWAEPLKWDAAAKKSGERRRVFCASMADVFEDREDLDAHRARLRRLIDATPHLDWLLLTKRPENATRLWAAAIVDAFDGSESIGATWPANVWLGATVEDQKRADERIPHLLRVPAAVRFLSCEPLLGPVTFRPRCDTMAEKLAAMDSGDASRPAMLDGIDWVIVGGESGAGAREYELAWARSIIAQCREASVAVFHKQLGALPVSEDLDDKRHVGDMNLPKRFRLKLLDRKGGDMRDWPVDLRVREFPEVRP